MDPPHLPLPRLLRLSLLVSIFLFSSPGFADRLTFLRLPPGVSIINNNDNNNDNNNHDNPLTLDQLEPLVANLVGLPSDLRWSGLSSTSSSSSSSSSSFDRVKANLLFVVVGGGGLGSENEGFGGLGSVRVEGELEEAAAAAVAAATNDDDDVVVENGLKRLAERLRSAYDNPPLVLFNAADDESSSVGNNGVGSNGVGSNGVGSSVDAALASEAAAIDRLAGAMKTSSEFRLSHLNASLSPDYLFLAELNRIKVLVDALSTAASGSASASSLVADATPDLFLFVFRSVGDVLNAYGRHSPQAEEMRSVLRRFIAKTTEDVEAVYGGKAAVEVLETTTTTTTTTTTNKKTTKKEMEEEEVETNELLARRSPFGRTRRAAAAAAAAAAPNAASVNPNIAGPYDWKYAAIFNMSIWTGVVLALIMYFVSTAMWNMDPGREGLIYRMTASKDRRE